MFDGNASRKRRINLGGRRTQQNKERVVKDARVEREGRALDKKKHVSASRIAAFWRTSQLVARARAQITEEWDARLPNLTKAVILGLGTTSQQELCRITRECLYISQHRIDSKRLTTLSMVLIASCAKSDPEQNFAAGAVLSGNGPWVLLTRRLIQSLSQIIHEPLEVDDTKNNLPVQLISLLCNPDTLRKVYQHNFDNNAFERTWTDIARQLSSGPFHQHVRTFILRSSPATSIHVRWNSELVAVLIRMGLHRQAPSDTVVMFAKYILSIPALWSRLLPSGKPRASQDETEGPQPMTIDGGDDDNDSDSSNHMDDTDADVDTTTHHMNVTADTVRQWLSSAHPWALVGRCVEDGSQEFGMGTDALVRTLPQPPISANYPSSAAWLLGNCLQFAFTHGHGMTSTSGLGALYLVSALVRYLPSNALGDRQGNNNHVHNHVDTRSMAIDDDDDDDQDILNNSALSSPASRRAPGSPGMGGSPAMGLAGSPKHAYVPIRPSMGSIDCPGALRTQLSVLYSPHFVNDIFHSILGRHSDGEDTDNTRDNNDAFDTGVSSSSCVPDPVELVCALYSNILETWSNLQRPVLTAIAYHSKLLALIWKHLRQSPKMGRLAEHPDDPQALAIVNLFSMAYNHLLITLDDTEFYDQSAPFTLDEVRAIVAYLKPIAYNMIWTGIFNVSSQYADALNNLTNVLMKLHVRDCRRKFCQGDDAWLGPAEGTQAILQLIPHIRPVPQDAGNDSYIIDIDVGDLAWSLSRCGELLMKMPYTIPFMNRVVIFRRLVEQVLDEIFGQFRDWGLVSQEIRIRRDHIYDDAFEQFSAKLNDIGPQFLHDRMQIQFRNEHGVQEAGVDGGGLFKEFMTLATRAAFQDYGLFKTTPKKNTLYPNPLSASLMDDHLKHFKFIGHLVGKAVFESVLLDIPFAGFFLNKLLGNHNLLNDLASLDPELHRNLLFLKHYDGDFSDLGLTFVITDLVFDEPVETELLRGGKDMPVTKDNVIQYIYLVAHYRLNVQIAPQCRAFLEGFSEVINPKWIRIFNQQELHYLIAGTDEHFDVEDLKDHTHYSHCNPGDPFVQWFWEVVSEFETKDQRALLQFVTSCERAPLLGFAYLKPPFCIHKAVGEEDRLPSASTCMNFLKLPEYPAKDLLKSKLLLAIHSGAGFEMS